MRLFSCKLYLIIAFLAFNIGFVSAEYWQSRGALTKTVIQAVDTMILQPVNSTYYCYFNGWIRSAESKEHVYYYAGNPYNGRQNRQYNKKNAIYIMSFWPTTPRQLKIKPLYWLPSLVGTNQVGEGASARIGGYLKDIASKSWQRHVVRIWYPTNTDDAKKFSYMGWWQKNLTPTKSNWRCLAVFKLPIPRAYFDTQGAGGFIEQYGSGSGVRKLAYRKSHSYYQGKWSYNNAFEIFAKPKEYQRLYLSNNKKYMIQSMHQSPFSGAKVLTKNIKKSIANTTVPQFPSVKLTKITAKQQRDKLTISWRIAKKYAPILTTNITILDKKNTVISRHAIDQPYITEVTLKSNNSAARVQIDIVDIFNQKSTLYRAINRAAKRPQSISKPIVRKLKLKQGINIRYYSVQSQSIAPDLLNRKKAIIALNKLAKDKLELIRSSYQPALNLSFLNKSKHRFITTTGYLKIKKSAYYYIQFIGCHVAEMNIGKVTWQQKVFNSTTPVTKRIYLARGLHRVTTKLYTIPRVDEMNDAKLQINVSDDGLQFDPIPASWWFYPVKKTEKEKGKKIDIKVESTKYSNQFIFTIPVPKVGSKIKQIALVNLAGETWCQFYYQKQWHTQRKIILPAQEYVFYLQVSYQDKTIITLSKPIKIISSNPVDQHWQNVAPVGQKQYRPLGALVVGDTITIMGDDVRWVAKKVTGDFTFQMRVKAFKNILDEKPTHSTNTVGLLLASTLKKPVHQTINWNYSRYFKGRYETPATQQHGLKSKHWQKSYHQFKIGTDFVKISRQGNTFTLQVGKVSNDKSVHTVIWQTLKTETINNMPQSIYVGPYIYAVTSHDPKVFFQGIFDQIKVDQNNKP